MFLPCKKVVCSSKIIEEGQGFSLLARTLSRILIEQLIKLIGLKSLMFTGFLLLGMRAIKEEFDPIGITAEE